MSGAREVREAVLRGDGGTLVRILGSDDGPAAAAALAAWTRATAGAAAAVAAALEGVPSGEALAAARELLVQEELHRPEILLALLGRGGRSVAAHLHRFVFPRLHGRSPALDAVYAGCTIADEGRRRSHVDDVRSALGDDARLAALAGVASFPVPTGHDVVRRDVGAGKTSRVHLVRRAADGALLAWKVPADDSRETREAMEALVERSADWMRLGVGAREVTWAPGGRTLLQPWVEGESLRAAVWHSSGFLSDPGDPRHTALTGVLRRIVAQSAFVSGLNGENLLFAGGRWVVIDSGHVRALGSPSEAWERQRADCLKKWTRWEGAARRDAIEDFLARADEALALPPPPFTLRRAFRRLRRARSS